jgi:putative two-component system response regulator
MKILVADDDEIAQAVAQKVLKSEGHVVLLAEDGEEALEILRREDIQLIITDWNMPNLDGIELVRYLRSNSLVGYIYVIMVTARTRKEDMLEGLTAGADDFVSKPFEPAELLVRVRNAERILELENIKEFLAILANAAESKDPETKYHLIRIQSYSQLLAEELIKNPAFHEDMPPGFPKLMFEASPYHDMGKLGIQDAILLKPGSLNDLEWQTMKKHAEIGAKLVTDDLTKTPKTKLLCLIRDIAWAHHERWDGSGYPRGLKGADIPLCARIMALADAYDAITMRRVYKAAKPHDVAVGIILEAGGNHFDPAVVDAFQKVSPQFQAIKERWSDE